ncbi:hypothetical protein, partial [Rhizobium phaseoli]|uniref:hypothetical protein n=1 Tax=Rhizobium phaseoli TaxID=396 RepID=UPI001AECABE3
IAHDQDESLAIITVNTKLAPMGLDPSIHNQALCPPWRDIAYIVTNSALIRGSMPLALDGAVRLFEPPPRDDHAIRGHPTLALSPP